MQQKIRSYSYIKKQEPLSKENSILKDKVHQMKFLIEDNLDILINELDLDLRDQAIIGDIEKSFFFIKENVDRWKEQIIHQKENIHTLEKQLEIIKDFEENLQSETKIKIGLIQDQCNQDIKHKQNEIILLNQEIIQVKELLQNCQDKLQFELINNEQKSKSSQQQLFNRITSLEFEINQLKQQHQQEIQALHINFEKDRKFFKEEIENSNNSIEQKYKKYYYENTQLVEKMSKQYQQIKQLKQQKDSLEKLIEQQTQKVKIHIEELANERKQRTKENKLQNELIEQLNQSKSQIQNEEKKNVKLKDQLKQQQELQEQLQQTYNFEINQFKTLIEKQYILQKDLQDQLIKQKQNYEKQLFIQQKKYENILGQNTNQEELLSDFLQDFECQYDDQDQIDFIQNLQQQLNKTQIELNEKNTLIADNIVKYQKFQISVADLIEKKSQEILFEQQKLFTKQKQQFDNEKEKLSYEYNYKLNVMQQQLSFDTDKLKCEMKELRNINMVQLNQQEEKTEMIDYLTEQISILKAEISKSNIDNEKEIVELKQQHQSEKEKLEKMQTQSINTIMDKLNDATSQNEQLSQQYQQLLKSNQEQRSQLRDQKLTNLQCLNQIDKLQKELQIQYDVAKSLNDRIKSMNVEVENAKHTYNIFAKTQRIPQYMSSEIRIKTRISPMNRKLRSISNTKLQYQ